jgi:hypothetical protein
MLVLGATHDPATPWAGAQRIAKAAGTNARMIVVPGGPHVIYGRGEGCPDWPVQHFIVLGELSEPPRKICEGDVADDYQRLPRKDISAYEDGLLEAWHDLDREIHTSADFVYWDGQAPLEVGCRLEGTIRYIPAEFGTDLELEGCSFADGLAFTGTGRMDDDAGEFTLLVRPDDMDEPFRRYVRDQLQEYVWPYQGGFSSGCFCETFRDGSGYGPRFRSGEERRSRIIERMKERAARDRHHRRQPGEDDGS